MILASSGRVAPKRALRLSWSDPRFRAIVWQVVILGGCRPIVWYLISNTSQNLAARRIATGFGFLNRTAGIPIGEALIDYNPAENTYGRALLIGVLNTLKVAVIGIVLATILGTLIGIGRLSKNWLMARLTAFYVETIRDLPLLLQLLFWYTILQGLPAPRNAHVDRRRGVLVQSRPETADAGLANRAHRRASSHCSRARSAPGLEPPRATAAGGDGRSGPPSGRSRWRC